MPFPVQHPKFNRYSFAVTGEYDGNILEQQSEALDALKRWFWEGNRGTAVVSMPTGSGKTGVLCCLPYTLGSIGMQPSRDPNNFPTGNPRYLFNKPILVIAPGLDIADQLEGQILVGPDELQENFLLRRGIIPRDLPDKKDILPKGEKIEETSQLRNAEFLGNQDIVIANAQKFVVGNWEEALPNDMFRVVIVDEAHHFPARTWSRIIDKFRGHASVVFFTATPYRSDGQVVVEDGITYHLPLEDARQRRIIRQTNFVSLHRWLNNGEQDLQQQTIQVVLEEVREKQVSKDRYHPLPGNVPHMAIAITKNTEQADKVVDMWKKLTGNASGAFAYHSKVPKYELQERKKRIRRNEVKLVVVVYMLQEGFDHPPISIAAILTKIGSPVKFVQFVGRAQRIYRGGDEAESDLIKADIITHDYYQQEENHTKFENEQLISVGPVE